METLPRNINYRFNRLQKALDGLNSSRFLVLFGPGVSDSYINPDIKENAIEFGLLSELKSRGFERVIYYSTIKSIYFLDAESANTTTKKNVSSQDVVQNSETMKYLDNGPYGNRAILTQETTSLPDQNQPLQMGDVHAIRTLDFLIRDFQGVRTAIVFPNFENTGTYFEDHRMLSGVLESWINLPESNQNRCIFLFASSSADLLTDYLTTFSIKSLENSVHDFTINNNRSPSVFKIAGPGKDEVIRLVEMAANMKASTLSNADSAQLIQWILGENQPIKYWINKIRSLDKLDMDEIRRSKWFEAVRTSHRTALDELNQLIGLQEIKNRVQELSAWMQFNLQKESSQKDSLFNPTLNFIFSGNPGTGKTTVARLIGEILHEIGYLQKGHLVEVSGLDLVADHLGGTAKKTNQVIDQALDGVLFIDEAYALTESDNQDFGKEAITTLLSRIENDRHRLVVIAAGYPDRMMAFLKSNPGLSRRFPLDNFFNFPDFSQEELWEIFNLMIKHHGLHISEDADPIYIQSVQAIKNNVHHNFGNAGDIRNFVDALDRKRAARIMEKKLSISEPLREIDIPEHFIKKANATFEPIEELLMELNQMIGLKEVKRYFTRLVRQIQLENLINENYPTRPELPIQHLIFSGNPGTGKTTVARLIGKLFKSLGLLKKGHCVEVSRADLVAGYVGQTAIKTQKKFDEAMDGVLFLDEAYTLSREHNDSFGLEAIDTIVKMMDQHHHRVIVITAGYPNEMKNFINSNQGIKSRFENPIHFKDFSLEELASIFMNMADDEGFYVPAKITDELKHYIAAIKKQHGKQFGNARTIHHIFQNMKGNLAERVFSELDPKTIRNQINLEDIKEFKLEDIPRLPLSPNPQPSPHKSILNRGKSAPSVNPLNEPTFLM